MSNHPTKVGGIISDADNNLLIVLGKYSQKWGVPKGSLNPDEKFLDGALREIKEETGLGLKPLHTKRLEYWTVNRARLYLLQVDHVMPKLKPLDNKEIAQAKWLDLSNEKELNDVKNTANKMLLAIIKKIESIMDASTTD